MRHLMPRFISSVRIVLALLVAGLGLCALSSTAGAAPVAAVAAPGDTMLPAGWELCVLQGLAAPATQANVDDLDEWQAAEGGSTNNSAAYNPFNTRRTTDLNNAPLPARGLLQRISRLLDVGGRLRGDGGHAAPAEHVVDHRGAAGRERRARRACSWPTSTRASGAPRRPTAHRATPTRSSGRRASSPRHCSVRLLRSASTRTSSRTSSAYEQAVAASAVDQGVLTSRNQELAAAQAAVSTAQGSLAAAQPCVAAIRGRRVREQRAVREQLVHERGPPDAVRAAGRERRGGTAIRERRRVRPPVARSRQRPRPCQRRWSGRAAATAALGQANATLASDTSAENRDLARLVNDVATLQTAGACTTVQLTVPTASAGLRRRRAVTTTTVPTTAAHPTTTDDHDDRAHRRCPRPRPRPRRTVPTTVDVDDACRPRPCPRHDGAAHDGATDDGALDRRHHHDRAGDTRRAGAGRRRARRARGAPRLHGRLRSRRGGVSRRPRARSVTPDGRSPARVAA